MLAPIRQRSISSKDLSIIEGCSSAQAGAREEEGKKVSVPMKSMSRLACASCVVGWKLSDVLKGPFAGLSTVRVVLNSLTCASPVGIPMGSIAIARTGFAL